MKKIEFQGNSNVIYSQLKLNRIKAGLTQSDLAKRLQVMEVNIDQQMISKIEHNARIVTDYELACLCMVLKTTPEEMLKAVYQQVSDT